MLSLFCLTLSLFQNFNFVVIGDRTAGAKNDVFERIIDEVKILGPDFFLNTGDLIEGYTEDLKSIESEWSYIINQLNRTGIPYHLTPGNHDCSNPKSESIYLHHFNKTYYSFDYEKCHFVIINNSGIDSFGQIPRAELNWLKQDLAKHRKALLTFCLMHKPFWYYPKQSDILHQFFKANGVDYVFSGHDHHYMSKVRDSIVYIQLGPSGSRYKQYSNEEQGAFQNYLLVNVKNNKANVAVIKPGNILPYDIVTTDDVALIDRIENEALQISKINIPENQTIKDTIGLNIENVTNLSLNKTLRWNINQPVWKIIPESVSSSIPPGSKGYYKFNSILAKPQNLYPLPELTLSYPYASKKEHAVMKILPIRRIASCRKTTRPPIIDGVLNDPAWEKAQDLSIFADSDNNPAKTESTIVLFTYDDQSLYLATKCFDHQMSKLKTTVTGHDDAVYKDDHLNFVLQPNLDSITYYQIFINPIGTVADRRCWLESGKSIKDSKWNLVHQLRTSRGPDFWTIELAIPFSQFKAYSTFEWGFNAVRYQARLDKVGIYQIPFVHDPKTFARLKLLQ